MRLGELEITTDWKGCHAWVIASREGAEVWRCQLTVTNGRRDLMARCEPPRQLRGHILIASDGEHIKASQSFEPRLHLVSPGGELLWSHPWRLMDEPVVWRDEVFLLLRGRDFYHSSDAAMAWLLEVDMETGQVQRRWGLRASDELRARYHAARYRGLNGKLELDGSRVMATLELRGQGLSESLRVHSDEPGEAGEPDPPLVSC